MRGSAGSGVMSSYKAFRGFLGGSNSNNNNNIERSSEWQIDTLEQVHFGIQEPALFTFNRKEKTRRTQRAAVLHVQIQNLCTKSKKIIFKA